MSRIEEELGSDIVASQRQVYDALYANQRRSNLVTYPLSFLDMRIRRARQLLPAGSRVLDVGCGSGSLLLRQDGLADFRYVGIDLSLVGLIQANKIASARNWHCSFIQSLADCLAFEESSFDGLFAISVIEHVPDPALFLNDCARVLKPGGLIVLHTPSPENLLTAEGFVRVFFPNLYAQRQAAVGHDHRRFIAPKAMKHLLEQHGFCGPTIVYYTDTLVEWLWDHAISPAVFAVVRRVLSARSESAAAGMYEVTGGSELGLGLWLYNSVLFPIVRLMCCLDRLIELTGQSGGYFIIAQKCQVE